MTDTDTKDTKTTVEQIIRIIKERCNFIRITTKDAKAAGYNNLLIANIHFNPKLAEIAVKYINKIRINPGNFYDKIRQYNY